MYTDNTTSVSKDSIFSKVMKGKNPKIFGVSLAIFLFLLATAIPLLLYLQYIGDEKEEDKPEVVEPVDKTNDKLPGWEIYRNYEYNFEMMYPEEWGSLLWEKEVDFYHRELDDVFVFEAENPLIEKVYYHEPTEILATVNIGEEVEFTVVPRDEGEQEYIEELYKKEINLFYQDGREKLLYVAEPYTSGPPYHSYSLKDLNFSPNGEFVDFTKWGFETSKQFLINIENQKNILQDDSDCWIEPYSSYKNIIWALEGESLIILEALTETGDSMPQDRYSCIWVSDYGNPESLNLIHSIPEEDTRENIRAVSLKDGYILQFEERRSGEEFTYDIRKGEFIFVLAR